MCRYGAVVSCGIRQACMAEVAWEGDVRLARWHGLLTQSKEQEWWQQPERRIDIDKKGMQRWVCSGASACWRGIVASVAL